MQLLASWKDSLTVFKPSNFKLFCLVTLKSMKETTKTWLTYWGWLVAVLSAFAIMAKPMLALLSFFMFGFAEPMFYSMVINVSSASLKINLIGALLVTLILSALVLSVRPSVGIKNIRYFLRYRMHALYSIAWSVICSIMWYYLLFALSLSGIPVASPLHRFIAGILVVIMLFFILCAPSLTLFYLFFLYDTDGTFMNALRSVRRTWIMVIYNLPFCFIAWALLTIACVIVLGLFNGIWYALVEMLGIQKGAAYESSLIVVKLLICFPIIVNVANNFYIKRLHEQFNLYFE